ncbi:aminotransferase class I/II-fold pyridoxal phosphate-dependent enzyme [Galactobacter sp.]|uniref:aminotransferase class I/II-fold pyridoxal phosphate-dependent enzyme n=1 Tax=Galactobacter sp. TaxID=2676125 RepID=UPI0025BF3394|nr:aminotransferase class I/II-fold pyridoxal phosphate-dependent enzyme [Galactobacter sp.]
MRTASARGQVPAFKVMDVLSRVGELRAQGREVLSLCAGEPSSGPAPSVNQAAAELHAGGEALNYTPAAGLPELREAIAGHYERWYDTVVEPGEVLVTTGASGAFVTMFLAAFDVGDRVALARPGYPAYRNILTSLGLEVVEIPCGPETRYQPTPELLDQATAEHGELAGLVLASPANPTGTMVNREELAALSKWCNDRDVLLVSDEIYHGITYPAPEQPDPRGVSAREFGDTAVVISSFSKFWGMPGWRVGWALLPPYLRKSSDALAGNVALCAPRNAQVAAVQAFTEDAYAFGEQQVSTYARNRGILLDAVPNLGWSDVAPADGAFYLYADISKVLGPYADSAAWCAALLEDQGVALTPGLDFDPVAGGSTVRLSFAASQDTVSRAVGRILAFQESLRLS